MQQCVCSLSDHRGLENIFVGNFTRSDPIPETMICRKGKVQQRFMEYTPTTADKSRLNTGIPFLESEVYRYMRYKAGYFNEEYLVVSICVTHLNWAIEED